jgi:hypothetical protein
MEIATALTGDAELNAVFRTLPTHVQAWALQPAVTRAARTIAAAVKPLAPVGTGLLAQSIGISKVRVLPKKGMVAADAGPRRGFVVTGKRKLSFTVSRKRAEKAGEAVQSQTTRYAHLTEKDHASRSGSTVAGTHWLQRGLDSVKETVLTQMQSDIAAGIAKQVAKLARN